MPSEIWPFAENIKSVQSSQEFQFSATGSRVAMVGEQRHSVACHISGQSLALGWSANSTLLSFSPTFLCTLLVNALCFNSVHTATSVVDVQVYKSALDTLTAI